MNQSGDNAYTVHASDFDSDLEYDSDDFNLPDLESTTGTFKSSTGLVSKQISADGDFKPYSELSNTYTSKNISPATDSFSFTKDIQSDIRAERVSPNILPISSPEIDSDDNILNSSPVIAEASSIDMQEINSDSSNLPDLDFGTRGKFDSKSVGQFVKNVISGNEHVSPRSDKENRFPFLGKQADSSPNYISPSPVKSNNCKACSGRNLCLCQYLDMEIKDVITKPNTQSTHTKKEVETRVGIVEKPGEGSRSLDGHFTNYRGATLDRSNENIQHKTETVSKPSNPFTDTFSAEEAKPQKSTAMTKHCSDYVSGIYNAAPKAESLSKVRSVPGRIDDVDMRSPLTSHTEEASRPEIPKHSGSIINEQYNTTTNKNIIDNAHSKGIPYASEDLEAYRLLSAVRQKRKDFEELMRSTEVVSTSALKPSSTSVPSDLHTFAGEENLHFRKSTSTKINNKDPIKTNALTPIDTTLLSTTNQNTIPSRTSNPYVLPNSNSTLSNSTDTLPNSTNTVSKNTDTLPNTANATQNNVNTLPISASTLLNSANKQSDIVNSRYTNKDTLRSPSQSVPIATKEVTVASNSNAMSTNLQQRKSKLEEDHQTIKLLFPEVNSTYLYNILASEDNINLDNRVQVACNHLLEFPSDLLPKPGDFIPRIDNTPVIDVDQIYQNNTHRNTGESEGYDQNAMNVDNAIVINDSQEGIHELERRPEGINPFADDVYHVADDVPGIDPVVDKQQTVISSSAGVVTGTPVVPVPVRAPTPPAPKKTEEDILAEDVQKITMMFPDVETDPVKRVLASIPTESVFNGVLMHRVDRIVNDILENPANYPKKKKHVPIKAASTASSSSSSLTKNVNYLEDYGTYPGGNYRPHARGLLMAEFWKFGCAMLDSVLSDFNYHYTPTRHAILEGLKKLNIPYTDLQVPPRKLHSAQTTNVLLANVDYTKINRETHTHIEHEYKRGGVTMNHRTKMALLKCGRAKSMCVFTERIDPVLLDELQQIFEGNKSKLEAQDKEVAENLNEHEYEEEGQGIECGCCFTEVPFEHMVQCYEGHLFCKQCLTCYAKEAVYGQGRSSLDCMTDGCEVSFPKSQLESALPKEMLVKYEERCQDEAINMADLDLVRCPGCDFGAMMDPDDKVFKCQNAECRRETCRFCKIDWEEHFGVPCNEIEQEDETKLRLAFEERMTEAKIRKCHRCKSGFTKTDGCNKMTCRCGAKQCYICRKPDIDYNHFCRHAREPGQGCDKCKACSLWTNPAEDDEKALQEVRKQAKEARKEKGYDDSKLIGAPDDEPAKKKQKTKH